MACIKIFVSLPHNIASKEDERCLHVALPVAAFIEMLKKSVASRVTTATRAGCVQRGLGKNTPFSRRCSKNAAEDDPRPSILQLNTEGLIASKITVIEQLAYKNKAFVIVLQEIHCTTADKLVIPNFSLAGSVLNKKHGLATFVHEQLEWSLVDQSPEQSETEWLCVDVARYNIISVYKLPHSRFTPTATPTFPCTPQPVCWRLQLPTCQLGLQQNIPWPWEPGLLGNTNILRLLYDPKEAASFPSHR